MRVKLPSAAEDDQLAIVALEKWHQVPRIDDLRQLRVIAVQIAEPVGVELADDQVALEHLAGLRNAELLGAKETQQEGSIWN